MYRNSVIHNEIPNAKKNRYDIRLCTRYSDKNAYRKCIFVYSDIFVLLSNTSHFHREYHMDLFLLSIPLRNTDKFQCTGHDFKLVEEIIIGDVFTRITLWD